MAYRKPGVEVTFQQRTLSPNVVTPTLAPVIIGQGYWVAEISDNKDSQFLATITNTHTGLYGVSGIVGGAYIAWEGVSAGGEVRTVEIVSGTITLPTYCSGGLEADSVYVDLEGSSVTASGANSGRTRHLWSNEFAVTGEDTLTPVITISGHYHDDTPGASGLAHDYSFSQIKVGYRALRTDLERLIEIDGVDAINDQIGKICAENPLSLALYNTLANSNTVVYGYGINSTDEADQTAHDSAMSFISARDIYTIVPLTQNASRHTAYVAHVDLYSTPVNKRERILICSRPAHDSLETSTAKTTVAQQTAALAYELSNRRVTYTFPPVGFIEERKHISTLSPSYIEAITPTGMNLNVSGLLAKLTSTITLVDGTKYYKDADITTAVWSGIMDDCNESRGDYDYLTVRYPVAGYIFAANVAGQIAGLPPQQGFTNLNIAGNLVEVRYSSDWFSESQLDTIAAGGNYILFQSTLNSRIKCRHQLTTDMSSIERRELSITKVLDYTAKTLRTTLEPYIGKYNITPEFLQKLGTVINAVKVLLKRAGVIADLAIESIAQDTIEPDVVLVTVMVKPYYPANYIRITLAF